MGQQKQVLKHPKQKKAKSMDPHTADEFLDAGVEQEEAGEKWRRGDAAKSSRFFVRAIEIYDRGLQRFSQSFDLTYNKARLQYELSQQPRLLEHLTTPLLSILHEALNSHRQALHIRPDDADTLFNTAQVLTSLGETLLDESNDRTEALVSLQEAVDIFEKCLSIQQSQLQEAQSVSHDAAADTQGRSAPSTPSPTTAEEQEQWASILAPITSETLLETCLAEAHALSTLLPLLPADQAASETLTTHSNTLLENAHNLFSAQTNSTSLDASDGIRLAQTRLKLLASLADHMYRSQRIDAATYLSTLTETYASSQPSLASHGSAQAEYADVLTTFNASVASSSTPGLLAATASLRWTALTTALSTLATANASPGPEASRSAINGQRGDIELLRSRLGEPEMGYEAAVKNREQLLRNAETYYKGAARIADAEGDEEGSKGWWGNVMVVMALLSGEAMEGAGVEEVLAEMRDDGLVR